MALDALMRPCDKMLHPVRDHKKCIDEMKIPSKENVGEKDCDHLIEQSTNTERSKVNLEIGTSMMCDALLN